MAEGDDRQSMDDRTSDGGLPPVDATEGDPSAPTQPSSSTDESISLAMSSGAAWEEIERMIELEQRDQLGMLMRLLPPAEMVYTVGRLDESYQTQLIQLLEPELAADVLQHLSDAHVAELIDELPPASAAAIVHHLDSDDQADILNELETDRAEAIIEALEPDAAEELRRLASYEEDTAGGVMVTEYLAYTESAEGDEVIADLRTNAEAYAEYDVQYVYVVDDQGRLRGTVPLRDLLLARGRHPLIEIMRPDPLRVRADTPLEELESFFDHQSLQAAPVTDADDRLLGVVQRAAVEEALGERAEDQLLARGGIVGGEELRSMNIWSRASRRLVFLVPNVGLNLVSISIISLFEETVEAVVALAVFLPLVAGIGGSSGNQAASVTLRELATGMVKPTDFWRVFGKEWWVGIVNGIVLGSLVFVTAWVWKGDPWLALIIGGAMPVTVLVSVVVGGTVPLLLRGFGVDPAMAAGPVLTTVTDLAGFFTVLSGATVLINRLQSSGVAG